MEKTYIIDFHGTIVKGYELEYKFYKQIFSDKNIKIKADLFLRMAEMFIYKKRDNLQEIYDIFEECLNTLNLDEKTVEDCIKKATENFSISDDVDYTLRNLKNKIIISRGIENLMKSALRDYNIEIYGNLIKREKQWKIERNIMSAEDKLKKLKEICQSRECGTLVVLGNGKSDIEILKYADIPVVTYNAPKQIKKK